MFGLGLVRISRSSSMFPQKCPEILVFIESLDLDFKSVAALEEFLRGLKWGEGDGTVFKFHQGAVWAAIVGVLFCYFVSVQRQTFRNWPCVPAFAGWHWRFVLCDSKCTAFPTLSEVFFLMRAGSRRSQKSFRVMM